MGTLNPDIPSEELTRALNEACTVMRGYRQRVQGPAIGVGLKVPIQKRLGRGCERRVKIRLGLPVTVFVTQRGGGQRKRTVYYDHSHQGARRERPVEPRPDTPS